MIKLEVGKYYRTRNGRKVGPMKAHEHPDRYGAFACPVEGGPSGGEWFFLADGTRAANLGYPELTLVAEWTDESPRHSDTNAQHQERETELERLVRVANEGIKALYAIRKTYREGVEEVHEKDGEVALIESFRLMDALGFHVNGNYYDGNGYLRIKPIPPKPAPKWPKFWVGPCDECNKGTCIDGHGASWTVRLSDDNKTLSVGCRSFDVAFAFQMLGELCSGYPDTYRPGIGTVAATRAGIEYDHKHKLSWTDADRILAALEAHFKALEAWKKEKA